MARFVNLCFEVSEDLKKFDDCELLIRNGSYFLRCYYSDKNYSDISLSSVHCSSGDMLYVVNHMFHFFNGTDSSVTEAYDIWCKGVISYVDSGGKCEKKKVKSSGKPKKFSKRCRDKTSELRSESDERRN